MDPSSSQRVSDATFDSSLATSSPVADQSDRPAADPSNSSPSPPRQDVQSCLRSEEYRQLFRLPPEQVLVQDFNCALQENFLLQGHMYVFTHFICFYSNLFGFETKKIIPFNEITSVRRANAAAIFPTAIEIVAGEKKFFFTSFLSRDGAFKLITDHSDGAKAIADQQDVKSEFSSQENDFVSSERTESFKQPEADLLKSIERSDDDALTEESIPLPNGKAETASLSLRMQDSMEEVAADVPDADGSSFVETLVWEQEDTDAPKVPEFHALVAEAKFPITVDDFFNFFFSNDAVGFLESFHQKCGDKEFRCSSWYHHEEIGHCRDVSFQHPIKLYFGAKFGICQEVMKYRIYRNSHLVIKTSQNISDVPYSDYFCVEGLWNVEKDSDNSKEHCILRVYTNVAFSKKTMWRGKIVQSTVEECREAYAIWINLAHEFLKKNRIEKEVAQPPNVITNGQVRLESQISNANPESTGEASELRLPDTRVTHEKVEETMLGSSSNAVSVASLFKDSMEKFSLSLKSQMHVPVLLVIIIAVVIVLMQISIVVLLARPQQVYVIPQSDCWSSIPGVETKAILEKGIKHLKDEMNMIEILLEKMHHDHEILKLQLDALDHLRKQQF